MRICLKPLYRVYHFFFPKLNKIEEPSKVHYRLTVDLLEPDLYLGKEIDFGKFLGRIDFISNIKPIPPLSEFHMMLEIIEVYDDQFKIFSEGSIYPVYCHSYNDVYVLWEIKDNILLSWEKDIGFTAEIDS